MELISRRGALQAIARLKSDYDCDYNTIVEKCRDAVQRLPTHGEERKTGKWVNDRYCSNCEWSNEDVYYTASWTGRYCPNCGEKMEVDE